LTTAFGIYTDYMSNQPMSDGKEIRSFFDEIREEKKKDEEDKDMTLDEAIKHEEEVAKEQRELFSLCPVPSDMCDPSKDCVSLKNGKNKGCLKCAEEHRQLAEFLKDYKRLKEVKTL